MCSYSPERLSTWIKKTYFAFNNLWNLAINFLERDLGSITKKVAMGDVSGNGRVMTSGYLLLYKSNKITGKVFKNQLFLQTNKQKSTFFQNKKK